MSKIILQPAGSSDASKHYTDTIVNPVSIERISKFVDRETVKSLQELHKKGTVPIWGVTLGAKEVNRKKWEKVLPGDIVLFSRDKKIYASAVVSKTHHSKDLALDLWGSNADGETYEYIYFLDEVFNQDISYEEFNMVAGYQPNNIIQGFNVLSDDKSERLITNFDLASDTYFPPITQEEFYEALAFDESKPLESERVVSGRTEQTFLRSALFAGHKYADCGICGKEYPVSFLVAAHIKKRASCSDEEKRDYKNIVMPMCKFGCDDLYEKGYISVEYGEIISTGQVDVTDSISNYIEAVVGRKCDKYNSDSKKYFDHHLSKYKLA